MSWKHKNIKFDWIIDPKMERSHRYRNSSCMGLFFYADSLRKSEATGMAIFIAPQVTLKIWYFERNENINKRNRFCWFWKSLSKPNHLHINQWTMQVVSIIIANALVILTILRTKQWRNRSQFLVMLLSISDICVGAVSAPLFAVATQTRFGSID